LNHRARGKKGPLKKSNPKKKVEGRGESGGNYA